MVIVYSSFLFLKTSHLRSVIEQLMESSGPLPGLLYCSAIEISSDRECQTHPGTSNSNTEKQTQC